MSARIILYLTINASVGLLVECTGLEVACPIYIISCKNCGDQYVGSATDFNARFGIHKSNIKTKNNRCGTARHFNNKCRDSSNPNVFLQVQLIESVQNGVNLESNLWEREKYWQCQLFTNTHGMNSGLTSIQVKEKIAGKTDKVSFVNLCNFMHCLHKCF